MQHPARSSSPPNGGRMSRDWKAAPGEELFLARERAVVLTARPGNHQAQHKKKRKKKKM